MERISLSPDHFRLDEQQIRSLVTQQVLVNDALPSTLEQSAIPLVLDLNQLMALSDQHQTDVNALLANGITANPSQSTLLLSPGQIAHLIRQHQFDLQDLRAMEERLQQSDLRTNPFQFTPSQLAYLISNQRVDRSRAVTGLTASQLLGLFALHQQASFSLCYSQVEQLALQQSK